MKRLMFSLAVLAMLALPAYVTAQRRAPVPVDKQIWTYTFYSGGQAVRTWRGIGCGPNCNFITTNGTHVYIEGNLVAEY